MLHRTMSSVPASQSRASFVRTSCSHPASVAVLGSETEAGMQVLANLRAGNFAGLVMAAESGNDLADLPSVPELALVCSDGKAAIQSITAVGRRGTTAAIVVGMADGLAALGRETGVRALGPGSFGIAIPSIGLNASRGHIAAASRAGRARVAVCGAVPRRARLGGAERRRLQPHRRHRRQRRYRLRHGA